MDPAVSECCVPRVRRCFGGAQGNGMWTLIVMLPVMCNAMAVGSITSQPVLSGGSQPWGTWRHTVEAISIDYLLPKDVTPNDVCCEVGEGWLCAWEDRSYDTFYEDGVWGGEGTVEVDAGPPLIFGRLAQIVYGHKLAWDIEERKGHAMLCISIPKAEHAIASNDVRLFDETLHIRGEQCLVAGLSVSAESEVE